MGPFEAWAVLEFGVIVIVAFVSVWRAFIYLRDVVDKYSTKAGDWMERRKRGL